MADWHFMQVDSVLRELSTDLQLGLNRDDVRNRLEKYGYNELRKENGVSPIKIFINQFKNILIIILLIATALSLAIGETVDALIIGVIVFFSAVLGFVQEYRAEKALEALKKMLAETITVIREGEEQEVNSKEIVPGDIMLLEAGDRVPADARLIEVASLRCDESPLTGESVTVEKDLMVLPQKTPVPDRKNMVYAGSTVTYGRSKAVITETSMNTEFGRIAKEVATIKSEKTPLEKRTEEMGKWLGITALGICLFVIGISILRESFKGRIEFEFVISVVMFGVALAVAAVPEALPAI
ncbi:MAG: HAD-IC family P-type ATPase, partial [Nitrospirota bacterium]